MQKHFPSYTFSSYLQYCFGKIIPELSPMQCWFFFTIFLTPCTVIFIFWLFWVSGEKSNVSSQIHLISPGCPRPNSALTVHKSGLKHRSSIHPIDQSKCQLFSLFLKSTVHSKVYCNMIYSYIIFHGDFAKVMQGQIPDLRARGQRTYAVQFMQ